MAGSNQRWWWWWCLPALIVSGCVTDGDDNTDVQRGALTGTVCGFEVYPSPQTLPESACENGRTVLGPVRFHRDRGKPVEETVEFDTSVDGDVCVTVRNGANGDARISSGHVVVDGTSLAGPEDFNQQVEGIEDEVALGAGSHDLDVQLASGPGSFVEVEVREPYPVFDTPNSKVGPNGALEITQVATDHPLLTPNGDGHHDETTFNVDGEPLIELPGKDAGTTAYFLEWTVYVYDIENCELESTNISGSTRVNSPTNVNAPWDGTDANGDTLDSGNYAYFVEVSLVREDGFVYDTVVSDRFGMIIDSDPVDYDERPEIHTCDPATDPFACRCPGGGGIGGADPNCSFGDAHPAHSSIVSLDDPSAVDTSFITATPDPETGRYQVTADLREFNNGGLVLQSSGEWASEAELRQWVSDLTGVPVGTGDSLFNFDYVQIGTSTGVTVTGLANHSFNHLLLDAITNADGVIEVNGTVTDVAAHLNDDALAPPQYQVSDARVDDECTTNGNTNGESTLRSKFCAYNEAIPVGSSGLGIYMLRTSVFDIGFNGETTTLDEVCILNGIFSCGYRTFALPIDAVEIETTYFTETADGPQFAFSDGAQITDATAVSIAANRSLDGETADGVCARGVVVHDGLRVRMDSGDGAVSDTCILNGIFF